MHVQVWILFLVGCVLSLSHLGVEGKHLLQDPALLQGPFRDLAFFGYDPQTRERYGQGNNASLPNIVVIEETCVRVTVLSSYLFRIESATPAGKSDRDGGSNSSCQFEDRATLAIVNRQTSHVSATGRSTPVVAVSTEGGILSIETDGGLLLQYNYTAAAHAGDSPFPPASLVIYRNTAPPSNSSPPEWTLLYTIGDVDQGNLWGTIRSLDELCTVDLNCSTTRSMLIHNESLHCAAGVNSLDGWTLLDDTGNYILGSNDGDWFSSEGVNMDNTDWYFFGHGDKYKESVNDYTRLSGRAPVPPRAMLGSWWTRWFDFNNADIDRLLGEEFLTNSIPLDTLVLDMNWHTKNDWTGWSWDTQLYPNAVNFTIPLIKEKYGPLLTLCNLHDADGVSNWEVQFVPFATALGYTNTSAITNIPFQPLSAQYMRLLDDIVLSPTGFDYYWIDWQSGGWAGNCTGGRLNPTIITNHVRGTDHMRRKGARGGSSPTGVPRDAVLARWGGYGSQRYSVGFSGDVSKLAWECFAFQPYYSLTAANVGLGTISHDLVGPPLDHELHVRIMQFGAFSGVMRVHDRGLSSGGCSQSRPDLCGIVNLWRLPHQYLTAIREAMQLRESYVPYIDTAMHKGMSSGIPLLYPMYFEDPTLPGAYAAAADYDANIAARFGLSHSQNGEHAQGYFGGDSMIVAPITIHSLPPSQHPDQMNTSGVFYYEGLLVNKSVWLPPTNNGEGWFDEVYGDLIDTGIRSSGREGVWVRRGYGVQDIPRFIRGGTVQVRAAARSSEAELATASQVASDLDFFVYPSLQWSGLDATCAVETKGSTDHYEDDGWSYDYLTQSIYRMVRAEYSRVSSPIPSNSDWCTVSLNFSISVVDHPTVPMEGDSLPRRLRLYLHSEFPPTRVVVNGNLAKPQLFSKRSSKSHRAHSESVGWYYEGRTASVVVELGQGYLFDAVKTVLTAVVEFDSPFPATSNPKTTKDRRGRGSSRNSALVKPFPRLPVRAMFSRVDLAKRLLDEALLTPAQTAVGKGYLKQAASRALDLSYLATLTDLSKFHNAAQTYHALVVEAFSEIAVHKPTSTTFYQLWDTARLDMLLCGTVSCILMNPTYQTLWVEGYQSFYNGADQNNSAQLYNYFNEEIDDNWTLLGQPDLPGYAPTPPYYEDGFILKAKPPGPEGAGGPYACVQIWFNNATGDHMTLLSYGGENWAIQNGYQPLESCIGYGYTIDPFRSAPASNLEIDLLKGPELLDRVAWMKPSVAQPKPLRSAQLADDPDIATDVVSRAAALIGTAIGLYYW